MKTIRRFLVLTAAAILMLVVDMTQPQWSPFDVQVVSDAHALLGRQRRTRRRGAAVGYEAGKAAGAAEANQQQEQAEGGDQKQAPADTPPPAEGGDQKQAPADTPPPAEGGDQKQAPADTPPPAEGGDQKQAPADTPPPAGGALPLGKVVNALPEGCTTKEVDGVEYYHDGVNYYRAVFQGNQLVYVTAQP